MRPFVYRRATSLAEGAGEGVRAMGGGTDLVPLLRDGRIAPASLVDVTRVADADARRIDVDGDGRLRLGALVTLADLASDAIVREGYAALAEAAASSATPQIRNVATIAGNLCQWNRCWYFRAGVPCHLTGGDDCPAVAGDHRYHAIFGDGPCVAVHPSDPAVALLALGASVQVEGPGGLRTMPLSEFLHAPAGSPEQASLGAGEVVSAVLVPPSGGRRSVYEKAMDRAAWAFALVSAAVVLQVRDGVVADAAVTLGGVAGVPWQASSAEAELRGQELTPAVVRRAAAQATLGARPLRENAYKVDLCQGVVRSALTRLLADGRG